MGGNRMRLEKVVAPDEDEDDDFVDENLLKTIEPESSEEKKGSGKVVSLTDRKPKK